MNDNKDYINTFIKRQRIISIICISFVLLSSTISAMAVSAYLYNSNEVSYNNNASGITSTNVQGAIDELYGHVTDYTTLNEKFDNKFRSNTTGYFAGNWVTIGENNTENEKGYLFYNGTAKRGQFYYAPSTDRTYISSNNSSGTWGKGILELVGDPVMINGTTIRPIIYEDKTVTSCASTTRSGSGAYYGACSESIAKSGYTILSITILAFSGSDKVFTIFNSNGKLGVITQDSTTISSITVRVAYIKN